MTLNTLQRTIRRRGLWSIAIGLPLLIGATGTAAATGSDGVTGAIGCWGVGAGSGWGMAGGGSGWGMGGGLLGGGMVLWPLLLLGLVAVLVYALSDRGTSTTDRRSGRKTDRAMAELREQYARGELSDEEFEQRRRTLERR